MIYSLNFFVPRLSSSEIKPVETKVIPLLKTKLLTIIFVAGILSACGGGDRFFGEVPPSQDPQSAPEPENSPEPLDSPEPVDSPESEPTPFPQYETEVLRMSWGSGDKQFADLYRPLNTESENPLAVVVMIHGGCWSGIYNLSLQADLSAAIASRGLAVWNIEYRALGTGGEWPALFLDVANAADYLRTIATTENLDMERVYAMGHSAGGHLALWLASRTTITNASPLYVPEPLALKRAVSLGGIPNLEAQACGSASRNIIELASLSGSAREQRLAMSSPLQMLPSGSSTLLISGAFDSIAPPSLSAAYVEAALAMGDNSEHYVLEGAGHFDLIDPDFLDMEWLLQQMIKSP